MKIIVESPHEPNGVSYHRLMIPFYHLKETYPDDYDVTFVNFIAGMTAEQKSGTDLYVFSRQQSTIFPTNEFFETLRADGARVMVDVDDWWHLPKTHILHEDSLGSKSLEYITESIRYADIITASTRYLANKVLPLNPRVFVMSNSLWETQDQWQPQPKKPATRTRFGWVGGICHREDVDLLAGPIERLMSDNDFLDNGQLVMCGYNLNQRIVVGNKYLTMPKEQQEWTYFEAVFSSAMRKVPASYKAAIRANKPADESFLISPYRRINAGHVGEYGKMYREFDVALAPLNDTEFNRCKSELKIIEAGIMGMPVIASDVQPYKIIKEGETGFLVKKERGHKDWCRHIKYFMDHPAEIKRMGQNLQTFIRKNYDISIINAKRHLVLSQLKQTAIA